jgi:hypothetical protein
MFFRKKIKFHFPKGTKESFKDIFPSPTTTNIPDWFKKLEHKIGKLTIKGCMPFLDSLTAGYVLKFPQDFEVAHNVKKTEDGQLDSFFNTSLKSSTTKGLGLNINTEIPDVHAIQQLGECPFVKTNKNLPFYKILLPFTIQTPPGYSTLFTPILNNQDDRFFPIAAIVDTDKYKSYINIPIVINGDKYKTLNTLFEKGTPLCQIIPFKRDNWQSEILENKEDGWYKLMLAKLKVHTKMINNYKKYIWVKKRWK